LHDKRNQKGSPADTFNQAKFTKTYAEIVTEKPAVYGTPTKITLSKVLHLQ